MDERILIFDIDDEPFSSAKFIWFLVRCDFLVVKTAREIDTAKKQIETVIENFEHKLQRSLPRPEILSAAEIKTANITTVGKPSNDTFFTKLKQLESSAVISACYRKNESSGVDVIIRQLINNYCNENYSGCDVCSILRLNIVGQGGGKFSAVFQNENLCKIIEGWFGVEVDGIIAGMLRINTNILRKILNSANITDAVKNALTRCQLLVTTNANSKLNIKKIINLFELLRQNNICADC
ncbi:MAG: hypothetical protein LBT09_07630 [Planctomycetaceae bacterium]|jgi:hypothetical protein|nr:hypothetical protein [Planctomycetaceae bacterium]